MSETDETYRGKLSLALEREFVLKRQVERLREALRPFAAYAELLDRNHASRGLPDECPLGTVPGHYGEIHVGDLRRARAAFGGDDMSDDPRARALALVKQINDPNANARASQTTMIEAAIRAAVAQERAENERLREALQAYLEAKPQCDCSEHSGCSMAAARARARAALLGETT